MHKRRLLQIGWLVLDVVCMAIATAASAWLLDRPLTSMAMAIMVAANLVRIALSIRVGLYHAVLRFTGMHTMWCLLLAAMAGTVAAVLVAFMARYSTLGLLGRAFLVVEALFYLVLCGGTRVLARAAWNWRHRSLGLRVLVYGAGGLGETAMRGLRSAGCDPVGFVDDDPRTHGSLINGRKVWGKPEDLPGIRAGLEPDLLLVAVRDLAPVRLREVLRLCMANELPIKVVRDINGLFDTVGALQLDDLAFQDLLLRPQKELDRSRAGALITDRVVAVTGAGGSIGREICEQVAGHQPRRLVLVDHGEFALFSVASDLRDRHPALDLMPVLADCAEASRMQELLGQAEVDLVFHAAAYKHVPLLEENPFRALANNVAAALAVVRAADRAGVRELVLISSDKAVRPANVMGASKRVCELIVQNFPTTTTTLCGVRFGNVLGSSGSVVPRFLEQIRRGGPVTVTHPEVTRYFMLTSEAVHLVLSSAAMAEPGRIYILDMGEPIRIADMARQLIFMTGNRPEKDIEIVYTGLRPGEKLTEHLLHSDAERETNLAGVTVARPTRAPWDRLLRRIDALLSACRNRDGEGFELNLRALVPDWSPSPTCAAILARHQPEPEALANRIDEDSGLCQALHL